MRKRTIICTLLILLVIAVNIRFDFRKIEFGSFAAGDDSTHVSFCNDRYIYYDSDGSVYALAGDSKQEICQLEDEEIGGIACNDKYIYCLTQNEILQMDYNGEILHQVTIDEDLFDFDV